MRFALLLILGPIIALSYPAVSVAEQFTVEETPAVLSGDDLTEHVFGLGAEGSVVCSEFSGYGELTGFGPYGSIRLSPSLGGSWTYGRTLESACEINLNEETLRGFWDADDCVFAYQADTNWLGEADMDINCPVTEEGEEVVEVHRVQIDATAFKLGCAEIFSQEVTGIEYGNSAGVVVDVDADIDELSIKMLGVCGSGNVSGSYSGSIAVYAEDWLGGYLGFSYEE